MNYNRMTQKEVQNPGIHGNRLIAINNRYHLSLNTRCHLLAFAAKVEKQLQATVSIQ